MANPPNGPERKTVAHEITHFHALVDACERMQMVPESVRPKPLLIDERGRFVHMRNLRDPAQTNTKQRVEPIGYDHPLVHPIGKV